MARTIRSANLDTRNKRLDLELRTEHCCTLSAGCYNRTAPPEARRKMMQQWADYLDGLKG